MLRRFLELWCTVDPRSLAVGRVALAVALLLDLARRAHDLRHFYTDDGLLPGALVLQRGGAGQAYSFFFHVGSLAGVSLLFALCAAVYVALLVGYRTTVAQVLAFACVTSLHARAAMLQNGGDVVLCALALWTSLLPTGRVWSLDARAGRTAPEPWAPVQSLAYGALVMQLALVYLFNAIHKDGETWADGSAVHYTLHQDRLVTPLGAWARMWLTPGISWALSKGALALEYVLPVSLLLPFGRPWTQRVAFAGVVVLHVGFGLFLNLGAFVPAMLAFAPHLVAGADWDKLEAWLARRGRALPEAMEGPEPSRAGALFSLAAREGLTVVLVLLATVQLFQENRVLRDRFAVPQPPWMRSAIQELHLFQGWSMFAPDAPTSDEAVVVDAITVDGRHVDPLNELASPSLPNPGTTIGGALGQWSVWCQYVVRIRASVGLHSALESWLRAYPTRTGRPEDELASFEVFTIEDKSPPPGELQPTDVRVRRWLRWPRSSQPKAPRDATRPLWQRPPP
jgi:hypothetical protein